VEFDVPSVEVMTWKLMRGLIAHTRSSHWLNVLRLVRELREKNMGMFVTTAAISKNLT